ncbi:MAG: DivIVA domain-containing protein [Fimbriimonadales bacterium]|nr:DivIVA domain-containing protein [Fimbriimonadales bacterium]MDW8052155.1 DivIVA domain-containing protein [Armatimonadota bacterium]
MNEPRRLSVLEIETKRFRKRLRGYDPVAVEAFLQEVAAHYEEILTENHRLREELIGLRQEAERYKAMEDALKESLVLAQRSADETRANAHKEAELILREAQQKAEQIIRDAEAQARTILAATEALEARKRTLLMELRALLLSHLHALERYEQEPTPATAVVSEPSSSAASGETPNAEAAAT